MLTFSRIAAGRFLVSDNRAPVIFSDFTDSDSFSLPTVPGARWRMPRLEKSTFPKELESELSRVSRR